MQWRMQKEQQGQRPQDDRQQKLLEKMQRASLAEELRAGTVRAVGGQPELQGHVRGLEFNEGKV